MTACRHASTGDSPPPPTTRATAADKEKARTLASAAAPQSGQELHTTQLARCDYPTYGRCMGLKVELRR
ncbi:hypothetical protein GCM10009625_08480 [Brachybacterium fresconis]